MKPTRTWRSSCQASSRWRAKRSATWADQVAAVIADTIRQAQDAAAEVVVDYEALDAVVDPYEARQPGAPQLYDEVKNNVSVKQETVHGDVDAALASSAIKVKAKIRAPRCAPMPMEGRATLAAPDTITRGLTIWVSNQAPHGFRNEIASAFGFGQNQVRAIAPEVGGGFGSKFGAYPEDFVVAASIAHLETAREVDRASGVSTSWRRTTGATRLASSKSARTRTAS